VIAAVHPALGARLEALTGALAAALPHDVPLVPSHGDFHADQLLVAPAGITVVDFDELCRAAPALDLATYAADVVRGREDDDAVLETVLAGLLAGYGAPPAALGWHLATALLGRCAHPFQRQVPDWPERTARMLAAAEARL
jgi:thiamine kinase-like enzyme